MNHLTGVQMGIFTNENDVILFFKRSQHLCLEMFVRKNKSYFRGGHMNSCTKVYFKIPCRYYMIKEKRCPRTSWNYSTCISKCSLKGH